MQPNGSDILDYASPRPHGRVRLPSASVLSIVREENCTVIREELIGKFGAIVAMAFAAGCLLLMTMAAWPNVRLAIRNEYFDGILVFAGITFLAGITTILRVIHNTWRKTFLIFGSEKLELKMTSPFTRRAYEWPIGNVVDAQAASNPMLLGAELVVPLSHGTTLRLFGGHPGRELIPIAAEIRQAANVQSSTGPPLVAKRAFATEPAIPFAKVIKKPEP